MPMSVSGSTSYCSPFLIAARGDTPSIYLLAAYTRKVMLIMHFRGRDLGRSSCRLSDRHRQRVETSDEEVIGSTNEGVLVGRADLSGKRRD